MLKLRALVRLLNPCSFRRGSGLTTSVRPRFGRKVRDYASKGLHPRPRRAGQPRVGHGLRDGASTPTLRYPLLRKSMTISPVAIITAIRRPQHPLMPSPATIERFLAHCHRRRYPPRTEVFRPGDQAGTMYYVVSGSVSIITEEDD